MFHHTIKKVMLRNIKKCWIAFKKRVFQRKNPDIEIVKMTGVAKKGTPIVRIFQNRKLLQIN